MATKNPRWRSAVEIDAELASLSDCSKLENLYALSTFWRNAVFSKDYRATSDWESALQLTDYGIVVLRELKKLLSDLPLPDVLLAFFGKFFHHELFFDFKGSNIAEIRCLFEKDLLEERIRFPYRYGRLLYDRFNDTYMGSRTEHLIPEEVQSLLCGTPKGVYQIGRLLYGPLGILDSVEARYIPPSLSLPLWHCSDTGCKAIHQVRLLPPSIPVVEAFSRIDKTLLEQDGPASEWSTALNWLHRGPKPRLPRPYVDLSALIGDCILEQERTILVELALTSGSRDILRTTLSLPPRRKGDGEGTAPTVPTSRPESS